MDSGERRSPFTPLDTTAAAQAVQDATYRKMTGRERTAIVFGLNRFAREVAAAGIRSRHPGYGPEEMQRALFRLLYGDALTRDVWPDRPLLAL
jgi:hypothetical protein